MRKAIPTVRSTDERDPATVLYHLELELRHKQRLGEAISPELRAVRQRLEPYYRQQAGVIEICDRAAIAYEQQARGNVPETVPERHLEVKGLLSAMVVCELAKSNGDARRLVQNSGVKVNGVRVSDPRLELSSGDVVSVGKNKHAKILLN